MKPLHLLIVTLTAAGFAACTNDDDDEQKASYQLTIEVTETPLSNPDAPVSARATRAAVITTQSLPSFTMDYQYGASSSGYITAEKSSDGKWTTTGGWPSGAAESDVKVAWYAHTGGSFSGGADPYISLSVEENASAQKDLLVATASGTYGATGGRLSLNFTHACTALRFWVKKAVNLDDYTLTVSSVRLCNVRKSGDYHYSTSSWSAVEANSSFSLYTGSPKTLGSADYEPLDATDSPYLFLIPQTLTAWDTHSDINSTTQSYIELTCTINNGATATFSGKAYIPFGADLEAGMQHDVRINMGKNALYSSANTKIIH